MSDAPPQRFRTPRQPRLRSSCDNCGAAKVKCDRGQPQCGRCLLLGLECVYGMSRQMGKPAREKLRLSKVPDTPHRPESCTGRISDSRPDDDNYNGAASGSINSSIVPSPEPCSTINDDFLAWNGSHSYSNSLVTSAENMVGPVQNDLFGSLFPSFNPLDFDENMLATDFQTTPTSLLETAESTDTLPSMTETTASQTQLEENTIFDSASASSSGSRVHDCSREAYDILSSLSLLNPDGAHGMSASVSSAASMSASTTHRIPFVQILQLNRESSERLSRLFACHCARWPHQALLYASIISLILTWYEKAASCTRNISLNPEATPTDAVSHHEFLSGTQSPWSTTALYDTDTGSRSSPTCARATTNIVAPTRMALGSFYIDDQQLQAAFRIQLLLSESRRSSSLIDLYRGSSGIDDLTFSSIDNLYKNLSLWLEKENSRIADVMRSKLKEASI